MWFAGAGGGSLWLGDAGLCHVPAEAVPSEGLPLAQLLRAATMSLIYYSMAVAVTLFHFPVKAWSCIKDGEHLMNN